MIDGVLHRWGELARVTDAPGLYAWYFQPRLTQHDIEALEADLAETVDVARRRGLVENFLDQLVYGPLREPPFDASLEGPLKPRYRGRLEHKPTISAALRDRLIERPDRLRALRTLFDGDPRALSSPLYIGMATRSLQVRIAAHSGLIEELRQGRTGRGSSIDTNTDTEEASFARAVVARGIPPARLSVCVRPMALDADLVDLENVLNRVFFPILGRN